MATHSTAYIPTNRKPNEYIMSEGWSDGMLGSTGFWWYQSTPRLNESSRAVMLIDGSPVFAPAGEKGLDIKEIDYIEENVRDMLPDVDDAFLEDVAATLTALEAGDWTTAEATAYAKMAFEEKSEKDLTQNNTLHTIADFGDLPMDYGQEGPHIPYDQAVLVQALKQYDPTQENAKGYTPHVRGFYYYHRGLQQWWGLVIMPEGRAMFVPLVIGFFIEGRDTLRDVKNLHRDYPDAYAKDIQDLAQFENAMREAL